MIFYCKWEESKQNETLAAGKSDLFHTVNSWGLGPGGAATEKHWNLYPHLCFETVFPALKLNQNCYLHYIYITIFS